MFSVTIYYIPSYKYSNMESALYNSLHRLGWSLFSGWMVLGCVTSESSAVKNFLSSRALVPLSRLTYCGYLTNGFIELYMAASIRSPKYMSITNLVISPWDLINLTENLMSTFSFSFPAWRNVIPRMSHLFGCSDTLPYVWIANSRFGEDVATSLHTATKETRKWNWIWWL